MLNDMVMQITPALQLRTIELKDQEVLFQLMNRIYPEAYHHLWIDQGKWYVEQTFDKNTLEKELADPNAYYWFVEWNQQRVGIFRLVEGMQLECMPEKKATKLHRIYLGAAAQGKGIGQALLAWTVERIRGVGHDLIWLESMDTQEQALRFYKKMGFEVAEPFRLTWERMHPSLRGMYRMWKKL